MKPTYKNKLTLSSFNVSIFNHICEYLIGKQGNYSCKKLNLEQRFFLFYNTFSHDYYPKRLTRQHIKDFTNLLLLSKEMNKHVFEYLRYIGIVDLAIDYRNFYLSKIYGLEYISSIQSFLRDFIQDIIYFKYKGLAAYGSTYSSLNCVRINLIKKDKSTTEISLFNLFFNHRKISCASKIIYCNHHFDSHTRCGIKLTEDEIKNKYFQCSLHRDNKTITDKIVKDGTLKYHKL